MGRGGCRGRDEKTVVSLGAKEEVGGLRRRKQTSNQAKLKRLKEEGRKRDEGKCLFAEAEDAVKRETGWGDQTYAGTEMMTSEIIRKPLM